MASVLILAAIMPQTLVIASPLIESSPITSALSMPNSAIESKSNKVSVTPFEYVPADILTIAEVLSQLLSSGSQYARLQRPNLEQRNADFDFSPYNNKDDNEHLSKILYEYFFKRNNRFPRRFGSNSKRAGM